MKVFRWNEEKNNFLKKERNISFEQITKAITKNCLIETKDHPNQQKYPNQRIFYVNIKDYIYAVPFVEDDNKIFLKTIYPDRNATKKYLGGKNG
ncbi:MAG: DUF4258 domain-containing protein [Candidatus Kapabacteria bacterium]|nr:DUF4258 domain-containing protein [Candidatus Kapabacteria bacterium]